MVCLLRMSEIILKGCKLKDQLLNLPRDRNSRYMMLCEFNIDLRKCFPMLLNMEEIKFINIRENEVLANKSKHN